MNEEITRQVIDILKEYVDDDIEITKDSLLIEDVGLSSLDTMQLSIILSDKFNVNINNKDIVKLESVNDIVTLLEKSHE